MEHAEALERIEIAAVEPDGLDRLMAGDTVDAAAVAGHLAACQACGAELARIGRSASLAREVIRTQPDPALRARTLAYVQAAGVARAPVTDAPVAAAAPAASPVPRLRSSRLGWTAAAAALLIAALGAGYLAGAPSRERLEVTEREVALLQASTEATLRLQGQPDVARIALVPTPDGEGTAGTLLFSPSSEELVMVANGLAPLGEGREYGCWIEVDGVRERIGRLYPAGDTWTWTGRVAGLGEMPSGAVFGVSSGPAGGGPDAIPVLLGEG